MKHDVSYWTLVVKEAIHEMGLSLTATQIMWFAENIWIRVEALSKQETMHNNALMDEAATKILEYQAEIRRLKDIPK